MKKSSFFRDTFTPLGWSRIARRSAGKVFGGSFKQTEMLLDSALAEEPPASPDFAALKPRARFSAMVATGRIDEAQIPTIVRTTWAAAWICTALAVLTLPAVQVANIAIGGQGLPPDAALATGLIAFALFGSQAAASSYRNFIFRVRAVPQLSYWLRRPGLWLPRGHA